MKFNKQVAIILVLLSMLLSAIAVSVYFYQENQKVVADKNRLVRIFVANKDIKKDTLITEKDIKSTTIARQFVLTKPLLEKEIVGKYAKETIYVNEAFLKQKLASKIEEKKQKKVDFIYNSYNMAYKMFNNPNFTLEPNDLIKIVSVTNEIGKSNKSVQYVIKNIRVLGFLADGLPSEKAIFKKKIKKVVKKKTIEEVVNVRASELILDIKEKDMLSLIEDWNKGSQLWMVKSKLEPETNETKEKEEIKKIVKKEKEPKRVQKAKYVKRTYPVKRYYPKINTEQKTAIIEYADNASLKKSKTVSLQNDLTKECLKNDKLLIATSTKVYLREQPSIRAKIRKKIYKNYVLAHNGLSKINPSWYVICDGSYIQKKDVREISSKEYKGLKK